MVLIVEEASIRHFLNVTKYALFSTTWGSTEKYRVFFGKDMRSSIPAVALQHVR